MVQTIRQQQSGNLLMTSGEWQIKSFDLEKVLWPSAPVTSGSWQIGGFDLEELCYPYLSGSLSSQQAALLGYITQLAELANQPAGEQSALLEPLEATQPPRVRQEARGLGIMARECRASEAELRCVIVLLAAERYRLRHNRWPPSVDELVNAGFLNRVPPDPYDGAPLRFRLLDDGILAYSVGPEGTDDGGASKRQHLIGPMRDIGYQLWNVDQRRQPPQRPSVDQSRPD